MDLRGIMETPAALAANVNVPAAAAAGHAAGGDAGAGGGLQVVDYEEILDIIVDDWERGPTQVKLKQKHRFSKVISCSSAKTGMREDELRCVFLGLPVEPCLTCNKHGMLDDDQVQLMLA